jgi:NADH dehydrogenase
MAALFPSRSGPVDVRSGGSVHRVVIVGGGFGGLTAARALKRGPVEVTLVDRRNFHLFQPLAYQVATGSLSPAEVTAPLRGVLKGQRNARVVLGEVVGFDLERREVVLEHLPNGEQQRALAYDTLIVAGGSHYSYFGHDAWQRHAPELKSLEGALEIRNRILSAFEAAEVEREPVRRQAWLTFVVVGAGPTGVEMAGQIGELARDTLRKDFRSVDTRAARVLLVEAAARVLPAFPASLSRRAARALEELGVTVLVGRSVVDVGPAAVAIRAAGGDVERVSARTVIWAAGVAASGLAAELARAAGLDVDRAGRVPVNPDLTLPGHPEVLALGDMVTIRATDGTTAPLPGLAPVAIQQGRYAARLVRTRLRGRTSAAFRYVEKGNLATIGRSKAVADIKGVRVAGFAAWALWLGVHLVYLIGFQNRLVVLLRWTISFLTRGRGARLIAEAALSAEAEDGNETSVRPLVEQDAA